MSIATHNTGVNTSTGYSKFSDRTEKVVNFVKQLHDFLPVLEDEYNSLEKIQQTKPNDKFPIKMDNLAAIYQAAGPLYELYVEKNKNYKV